MGQAAVKSLGKEREEGAVLCCALLLRLCIVIVIVAWHGLAVYSMRFRNSGYVYLTII